MSIKSHINSCNIFIFIFSIYIILSARETSTLTGLLLMVLVAVSFCYFLFVNLKLPQPKLLKWLSILTIVFLLYGAYSIIYSEKIRSITGNDVSGIDYIKNFGSSLFVVYPFYYFALKGTLTSSNIIKWLPIFLCLAAYSFFMHYYSLLNAAQERGSLALEFTNNMGYVVLSLLPLLFIRQKRILLQYLEIGICGILIVAGVKRGAILIGSLLILYFLYGNLKLASRSTRKKIIIISIISILISGYFIRDFLEGSEYFQNRVNNTIQGDMNGRDSIYSGILDAYLNSNIFALIFGHGANSSIYFTGMYAHSDWLEILINQGALGIIIYIIYFIVFYHTFKKFKNNPEIGLCLGALFLNIFLRTFFSMSYAAYSLFTCVAYGYCCGYIERRKIFR